MNYDFEDNDLKPEKQPEEPERITSIEVQKKNPGRVSIFLNEKFWIGMSNDLMLESGLEKDQMLDFDKKQDIEAAVVEEGGLTYALNRLSSQNLSESQLRDKLKKREFGDNVIDKIIKKCYEFRLLDDKNLARLITEHRKDLNQGPQRSFQHLYRIGIPKPIAEETIEEVFADWDEAGAAEKLLESKYKDKRLDRKEQHRAIDFLLRNGFKHEVAFTVVGNKALSEEDEIKLHGVDEAKDKLIRKYGKTTDPEDPKFYGKAMGYLSRQGFLSEVIKKALKN